MGGGEGLKITTCQRLIITFPIDSNFLIGIIFLITTRFFYQRENGGFDTPVFMCLGIMFLFMMSDVLLQTGLDGRMMLKPYVPHGTERIKVTVKVSFF